MTKKKILVFIDWFLPGYKAGGPIQSVANLVANLKDEFDFSIVTRDTDYCEIIPYTSVKSNEWNILPDGTRVYYFSDSQLTRSNIRNLIRKEDFDTVYLNGIFSLYFTLIPLYYLRKKHDKSIVIAGRGMFAGSALNVKKTKKQFFIRAVKVLQLFDKVLFHATNENEKEEIKKVLSDKVQIKVAGNLPQKNAGTQLAERVKLTGSVKLVNVSRIAPEKNLLVALEILKQVKSNVEFDFYGPVYDQEYWSTCRSALDELPSNIKANYNGSIEPDKVSGLLKNYHFMFMPTRGENFGHIILQSLSAGCPVIISDKTPWEKLYEKKIGWDISLGLLEKFTDTIDVCSRMQQIEYNTMSRSAFEFAEKYNNNKEIIEQNRALFR